MISYSKFEHNYSKSFLKFVEPVSQEYKVWVNGEEVPVYTCNISKYPFNTVWPGHQRPVDQTLKVSYINIVSDEDISLEILPEFEYNKMYVKPYSKQIPWEKKGEKISISLKKEQNAILELDSHRHLLYIFNSKPIPCENPEDVTYYFGPGIHFAGKITMKSNESLYVDKDALVYGCIYAEGAENIRVFGNGVFDDSMEERVGNYCYEEYVNGNIKFYDCKNIKVNGVGFKNSAIWCVSLFGCYDVEIDNIKVFGQWRYNTDGIDIVNCQNIFINNSFIHSFDDTITIKGIDRYTHIDNKNIHIDNCILWCDWGKCCEVGIETACREYKDISFTNCDILRAAGFAIDVQNGDFAEISDVRFENISVDMNTFDEPCQYQENDDMKYSREGECEKPILINFTNWLWRTKENEECWGVPVTYPEINLEGIKYAALHDITAKNIYVYCDEDYPYDDFEIIAENRREGSEVYNINISDIYVNGKKIR